MHLLCLLKVTAVAAFTLTGTVLSSQDAEDLSVESSRSMSLPRRRRTSIRSFFFGDRSTNTTSTACIGTDAAFRKAVAAASSDPRKPPTVITLCNRVKIANTKDPTNGNATGISLSNKRVELRCSNPTGARCIIDGQRSSRIFFGSKTFLRATGFDFINAYSPFLVDDYRYSSALSFNEKSTISLNQCSFRNNRNEGDYGTISVVDSNLTLRGTASSPMVFSSNHAYGGGALYADRSILRAVTGNIVFSNNTASLVGVAMLEDTDTAMAGVKFLNNVCEDYAVMQIQGGKLSLEDTIFQNNNAPLFNSAVSLTEVKSATFKRVRFENNTAKSVGALMIEDSSVSLINCTFKDNFVLRGGGADIYIARGYSSTNIDYVSCDGTVFCDGVGMSNIYDYDPFKNTNCVKKGIVKVCRS